jgi:histidine ammonia-lyase
VTENQLKALAISGQGLCIDDVVTLVTDSNRRVAVSDKSLAAIAEGHSILQEVIPCEIVYGVNTGFGPMASCVLPHAQLVELQYNLVRSHAVGVGDPIESRFVLAAMLVRLNTLAQGASGVSVDLAKALEDLINHRVIPIVPEHGAVGTSGDLVQLAHVALALIGEGNVSFNRREVSAKAALEATGLKPYQLGPKEGLSLINGTSMMTAIAALVCAEARQLVELATLLGALGLEIVRAFDDGISHELHARRPHPGQRHVAARLRNHLDASTLLRDRRKTFAGEAERSAGQQLPECVQEVYSLRCIPQILGPIHDAVERAADVVETELNSVTDNPIVSRDERCFLHGGNFHGDYVATAMDQLKIAIVKLTILSERRVNFYMTHGINRVLPPFLNLRTLGLNLGLQGMQFVATSTTAQSQTFAFPQSIHSIPTNGDNQDVVSMGTDAALLARKVIDNATIVTALEAIAATQAVDCMNLAPELSTSTKRLYDMIRALLPKVTDDRPLSAEIASVIDALKRTPASHPASRVGF